MSTLEQAVAHHIAKLDDWTTGINVFIGPLPPTPAYCVGITMDGSRTPNRTFSGTSDIKEQFVQVRVRSAPHAYQVGSVFVEQLWNHLDRVGLEQTEGDGYIAWDVLCSGSAARYLGQQDDGTNSWQIELQTRDHRATAPKMPPIPQPDLMWAARLYDGPLGDPVLRSDIDLGDDYTPIPGAHYITPGTIVADQGKLGIDLVVTGPTGGSDPLLWLQQNAVGSQPAFRRTSPEGQNLNTPRLRDAEGDKTKTQWLHDGTARVSGFLVARIEPREGGQTNKGIIGNCSIGGSTNQGFFVQLTAVGNSQTLRFETQEAPNQRNAFGMSFSVDIGEPFFGQWIYDSTQAKQAELRKDQSIDTGQIVNDVNPQGEATGIFELFATNTQFYGDIAEIRIYKNLAPEFEPRIRRELALLYPTLDIPVDRSMSSFSLENALVDDLGQILFIEAE